MRGKEEQVEDGIRRSVKTGLWRVKVSAVVDGKREYRGETFPKATHISKVRAARDGFVAELSTAVADGGGRAERGLFSGIVQTYWTRATLSPARKAQVELYLKFWLKHFGRKTADWMLKHIPELKAALNTVTRIDNGKPASVGTKDHYVSALSNVWTVMFGEDAPNPGKKIGLSAETDPTKLPRRDHDYFLIDAIFAHMPDDHRITGVPCIGKLWLQVFAYTGINFAQLETMGRDDFYPVQREIIPPGREKGEGAATNRRKLTDDAFEAFVDFDRANQWGAKQPEVWHTFKDALGRALAWLQAHPEAIPEGIRIDWKRASKMRPYDLRHCFGTEVMKETRDREITGQYLGHAPGSRQTGRYIQGAITARLEAAGDGLTASFRSKPRLSLVEKRKTA